MTPTLATASATAPMDPSTASGFWIGSAASRGEDGASDRGRHHEDSDRPGQPAPAPGGRPPVGEQQQDERGQAKQGHEREAVDQADQGGPPQHFGAAGRHVGGVGVGEADDRPAQAGGIVISWSLQPSRASCEPDIIGRQSELPAASDSVHDDRPETVTAMRYREANRIQRFMRWSAATAPMSWLYVRVLHHIDRPIHRLTRGRHSFVSLVSGLPVVMLTTTGAKTRQQRVSPVIGLHDGDGHRGGRRPARPGI